MKLDELLKNADEALYRAKEAGKNCVMKNELVTQESDPRTIQKQV